MGGERRLGNSSRDNGFGISLCGGVREAEQHGLQWERRGWSCCEYELRAVNRERREHISFSDFPNLFFSSKSECGKTCLRDLSVVPKLWSRTCVCYLTSVCFTIMKWPTVKLNWQLQKAKKHSCDDWLPLTWTLAPVHVCSSTSICVSVWSQEETRTCKLSRARKRSKANIFLSDSESHPG